MTIVETLQNSVVQSLFALYGQPFVSKDFQVSKTKPEFEGDYTVVLFSLVKSLKKSPEVLGNDLGQYILQNYAKIFHKYNVIKGF